MNILLIEDTKSHSDFIMAILKNNNHEVKLFIDGKSAYNYLKKPDIIPDVVITDNFLPSMTGLEIIEYFNKNNYNYAFIILTSGQSIDLAVKGMQVGALEYVSKSSEIQTELQLIIEKAYKTNQEIILRKKMQKELKESEQQLRKLNDTKDKFFSIISHDLRGPFSTMLGFSKLLDEKYEKYDTEQKKKFISILNNDIKNTYKLLENLLQWSRSQRNNIDFKPERQNLYLLLSDIVLLLNNMAEKKSITIINSIDEDKFIFADKDMLETILRNLISNAIKFTKKGGIIEIGCVTTRRSVEARHALPLHQETDSEYLVDEPVESIELYVKDNGLGIDKEKQKNLFTISKNISTNGTENESGTGLGLLLCKEFVEKHEGKIWVESEEGKGSTFYFTIPIN